MNAHDIAEAVRLYLAERLPGISIHTSVDNMELKAPYLLVQATSDTELVQGNHTWEMTLSLEYHTPAHDTEARDTREGDGQVVRAMCLPTARRAINALAQNFYLYSIRLTSQERTEVQDATFVQHATFRVVAQF